MPLSIIRDNIVHMQVDAVVNAANTQLIPIGGVSDSIFHAAGEQQMSDACQALAPCTVGDAVITPGFNLPARYVIHAVGPVWLDGEHGEEAQLRACYRKALALAVENACTSVAFPLLATGSLGYPRDLAMQTAIAEIGAFLMENDMNVTIVVYDRQSFQLSAKLFKEIEAYIDDTYVREREQSSEARLIPGLLTGECARRILDAGSLFSSFHTRGFVSIPLEDALRHVEDPFSKTLLRLIDERGRSDVEVYKRANLDRKLFSKIRTNSDYKPSKYTALALAVSLELSLTETRDLLARAGYALSPAQRADVIVEYFIVQQNYDIHQINEALFAFEEPLLGL